MANSGDGEKFLAMTVLGLGSFLTGMLPAVLPERHRRRFPLATSSLLCFGAGVLLATALVHILPEVREEMKSNFAEIYLCVGFFSIYFVDEFIHYFFGEPIQHNPPTATDQVNHRQAHAHANGSTNYGAITTRPHTHSHSETSPLMPDDTETAVQLPRDETATDCSAGGHVHCADIVDASARICHTSHSEPCEQSMMTGTLGLIVALSLHSAIEGLAIGVQNSATKVLFLLGAVSCHKFVMGFCLGLEFRSNPHATMRSQLLVILVFAFAAVGGILIGMLIVDMPNSSVLPIVQALAGGTLLYVTVCEVIPREKARWHQNPNRKMAGFAQFAANAIGFAALCVINFYMADDDKTNNS